MRYTNVIVLAVLLLAVFVSASDKNLLHRWRDGVQKKMHNIYDKKLQRKQAEVASDKKVKIDDIFNWIGKGKQVYDIFKGMDDTESEIIRMVPPYKPTCMCVRAPCNCPSRKFEVASDKKVKVDDIFNWIGKGKQIYDIFKGMDDTEVESDLKLGKALKKIGKGALKIGKAYVGQKYGINLSDEEIASDLKLGKALKKIGKGALKIGKAYVGQKYGINLSDSSALAGIDAASWAAKQAGKGYSQQNRLGPGSFDCSGLINQAYKQAGVSVPSTTRGYPGSGMQTVSPSNIRPGDILHRPGHVGMYIGNGKVVNAENSRTGVAVRNMDWYKRNMGYNTIYRPN